MFARFDENPAMTLQDIKKTKRYGRTDGRTHTRTHTHTHGQRENSIPHHKQSLRGGIKTRIVRESDYSPLQYLACSKRPECLRILSGNVILTSIKGHNTLKNLGKMTANNPNLDLVIINR